MGAMAPLLQLQGRLIDPFSCGDPAIQAIWPDTGPDLATLGTRGRDHVYSETDGGAGGAWRGAVQGQ